MNRLALFAAIALALSGCTSPEPVAPEAGASALPALADLADGWTMLRPGGQTVCAQGTEYAFFARPARADRVLLYLQGGGACWNADNCDPDGEPTYTRDVDETDDPGRRAAGIFDLDNADNPLADYSMVMAPYCTGDVHIGDILMTYVAPDPEGGSKRVTVNHRGWRNGQAVLQWLFANFDAPAEIVVAGTSAGSIPSPLYGQLIADRYPDARVTVLGDAAGAYRREVSVDGPTFEQWGTVERLQEVPGYEGVTDAELSFSRLYVTAGDRHPEMQLLQYDAANDGVQAFYLRESGVTDPDVHALLRQERGDIRARVPGFRAFTAGGGVHGILTSAAFYTYEVGGLRFRDWFAAAVAGEEVADVECGPCARPELHASAADAEVAERAAAMLADAAAWNREDDNDCRDDGDAGSYSLRCALQAATRELGAGGSPAADEVRFVILAARDSGEADPLRAFNNDPETTHAEILEVLGIAAANLRAHSHD